MMALLSSMHLQAMVMFGQAAHGHEEDDIKEGDEELWMGRMLPFFQDLANLVDRCNSITVNIIHQLVSIAGVLRSLALL